MLWILISGLALATGPVQPTTVPVVTEVIEIVREHFYDPGIVERQWADIEEFLASPAVDGLTASQVINRLLDRLDTSHTSHYTPDQQTYYELLDIYSAAGLFAQVVALFPKGVSYVGIGAFTQELDGGTFITDVWPGGPAADAGLMLGDEIIAVNDQPFHPIASFAEKEGQKVALTVRPIRDAPTVRVTVTPRRIRPSDAFEQALRSSATVHRLRGVSLGYIRPISYAGQRFQDALVEELSKRAFKRAAGLVLDLRGGWGGASPEFAEVFLGGAPSLTMITRDGFEHTMSFRWRKPLVVLIDGGTRSGKEVLSHAFNQAGIPLIGTNTAGAVVGGSPFLLSDGSLLIVAAMDALVDGQRLEGVGIAPTVPVEFDPRYAGGSDPQLDAALEELYRLIVDQRP